MKSISSYVLAGILCAGIMHGKPMHDRNMSHEDSVLKGEDMKSSDKKISQHLLNELLANETVMLHQTLNYHWNITGPEFHDYHLLFDAQYNALFLDLDRIAERVRAVEGQALGSMKDMIKAASLKEDTGEVPAPKQMVKNLLKQYEALIEQIVEGVKKLEKSDIVTSNFLQDLAAQHQKTAWMLRSLSAK
ncbi:MAG: DNA starvation/stationary phase protection protein [Candidatus Dependentiae bacterium]|nr:DNA starvation/stationary phase protection protein [Candidatus Dependentiae bacterium]